MYSVGCDGMMMWQLQQSVLLDFSWHNVQQSGHLTRIVSGCNNISNRIQQMSKTSIPHKPDIHFLDNSDLINQCLSAYPSPDNIFSLKWNWNTRFHVIFVPSFDDIQSRHPQLFGKNITRYPQLNRILALFIIYHCTDYQAINQDFMMMLDPDFIFLHPLHLRNLKNVFHLDLHRPVAARYGLGSKWMRWLKTKGEVIPADTNSHEHFEAGVPYILHNKDWYDLIPKWIEYIPFAYANYKGIESDMYSYMIAAYKLKLQHHLSEIFMSTCMKSMDQKVHPFDEQSTVFVHYCSAYHVDLAQYAETKELSEKIGDSVFVFNKHWTKARVHNRLRQQQLWMIECASPLIIEVLRIEQLEDYDAIKDDVALRKKYKQYKVVRAVVPMLLLLLL